MGKIPILTNIFQMSWNHYLGGLFLMTLGLHTEEKNKEEILDSQHVWWVGASAVACMWPFGLHNLFVEQHHSWQKKQEYDQQSKMNANSPNFWANYSFHTSTYVHYLPIFYSVVVSNILYIFTLTRGNDPIWRVETTNYSLCFITNCIIFRWSMARPRPSWKQLCSARWRPPVKGWWPLDRQEASESEGQIEISWNIMKNPMEYHGDSWSIMVIHGVSLMIAIDFTKDSKDLFPCFSVFVLFFAGETFGLHLRAFYQAFWLLVEAQEGSNSMWWQYVLDRGICWSVQFGGFSSFRAYRAVFLTGNLCISRCVWYTLNSPSKTHLMEHVSEYPDIQRTTWTPWAIP